MRIKVLQLGLVRISIYRFTDLQITSVFTVTEINYLHMNIA